MLVPSIFTDFFLLGHKSVLGLYPNNDINKILDEEQIIYPNIHFICQDKEDTLNTCDKSAPPSRI